MMYILCNLLSLSIICISATDVGSGTITLSSLEDRMTKNVSLYSAMTSFSI